MRLALAPFLAMVVGVSVAGEPAAVDRTFTAPAYLTRARAPDTMTLHVTARSPSTPFRWTLIIRNAEGKQLFRVEHDDSAIDKFFAEDGYIEKCSGYDSCKQQYYFHDLPRWIFSSADPAKEAWLPDDRMEQALYDNARPYLEKRGVAPSMISKALDEMKATLSHPGFRTLILPIDPMVGDGPRIWVSCVHDFVTYYHQ